MDGMLGSGRSSRPHSTSGFGRRALPAMPGTWRIREFGERPNSDRRHRNNALKRCSAAATSAKSSFEPIWRDRARLPGFGARIAYRSIMCKGIRLLGAFTRVCSPVYARPYRVCDAVRWRSIPCLRPAAVHNHRLAGLSVNNLLSNDSGRMRGKSNPTQMPFCGTQTP